MDKWPTFPSDYLESRRDYIYNQINQYELSVSEVHELLLKSGPWISKKQLKDALRNWIDEEPMDWRSLPELGLYTTKESLPSTIDDLLEEYGDNQYDDVREEYDGRDDDFRYCRADHERRNENNNSRIGVPPRTGRYGEMNEYDDDRGQYEIQARYEGERDKINGNTPRNEYWKDTSKGSYEILEDYYHDDRGEGMHHYRSSSNPEFVQTKPAIPRTSIMGLGQTMASKYEPGLHSRMSGMRKTEVSKHHTYNFIESLIQSDSAWALPETRASIDSGPRGPLELGQAKLPRPPLPDILEANPVSKNSLEDLDAQDVHPNATRGGVDGYGEWAMDEVPGGKGEEMIELEEQQELARQEKEYNNYDWQVFMQAVKQSS